MEDAPLAPVRRRGAAVAVILLASCARHAVSAVPLAVGMQLPRSISAPFGAPNAPPRIVRIWISQNNVTGGDVLRGHVTTTTNVASLEVRLGPKSAPLKRTTFGQFEGTFHVPTVPSFLHRSYSVDLIARNAAGTTAQAAVTIDYR